MSVATGSNVCIDLILLGGSILILLGWLTGGELESNFEVQFPLIVLLSLIGMSWLVSSGDLISVYLAIELQTLALYVLASLYNKSESSTSSGMKYFLIGALSSSILLLGISLIFGITGMVNLSGVLLLVEASRSTLLEIGLLVVMLALLIKVGASPFHNWAPDVYDGVPTIVTSWLIVAPKVALLSFLFEVSPILAQSGNLVFVMLLLAFLSMLTGGLVGLVQSRIKRLIGYSSISHLGFMLFALSTPSGEGGEAYLFYLLQYVASTTNLMIILLMVERKELSLPLAVSLATSLFSLAGIPPLMGFFGKLFVLNSAIYEGHLFMGVFIVAISVISAVFYLRVIKIILFQSSFVGGVSSSFLMTGGTDKVMVEYECGSMLIAMMTLSLLLFILDTELVLGGFHLVALSFSQV